MQAVGRLDSGVGCSARRWNSVFRCSPRFVIAIACHLCALSATGQIRPGRAIPTPSPPKPQAPVEIASADAFQSAVSEPEIFARLTGHSRWVNAVAFSPDGSLLASAASDGAIRLWNTTNWKETAVLKGHAGSAWAIAFSPDGRYLSSGGADKTVRVWHVARHEELAVLRGHRRQVDFVGYATGGDALISSGPDRGFRFWNMADGTPLRRPVTASSPLFFHQAISRDGGLMACTSGWSPAGWQVRLLDPRTGRESSVLAVHRGYLVGPPNARNAQIKQPQQTPGDTLRRVRVDGLALSPRGKRLAVALSQDKLDSLGRTPAEVQLWDADPWTRKSVLRIFSHGGKIDRLAFSADGRMLAVAGYSEPTANGPRRGGKHGDEVQLWDLVALQPRRLWRWRDSTSCMAFSPRGRLLAIGGADGTVRLTALSGEDSPRSAETKPAELAAAWLDLGGEDAGTAYDAMWKFAHAPDASATFIDEKLVWDGGRIEGLLLQLEADYFSVRETASEELKVIGRPAESALRRVLKETKSAEAKSRILRLLSNLESSAGNPTAQRRILRVIELLELLGTSEAEKVLARLAQTAPTKLAQQEAKTSLARVQDQRRKPPADDQGDPVSGLDLD
ncbi:MAG: WD40 repeat domain-containing protein [Planctomycetales bacterium]